MEGLRKNYTVQAWLVLLLAICFGGSLAGVQITLAPRIAENKINETRRMVPELVLGAEGVERFLKEKRTLDIESERIEVKRENKKIFYSVFRALENGKMAGWVVKSSGQGYADKIELLIGFDPLMNGITGIFVLEQKETPGLGNKIADERWRSQFVRKGVEKPLKVVKNGASAANEIDAITGATISSRSVCSIVNTAADDLKGPILAGAMTESSILNQKRKSQKRKK